MKREIKFRAWTSGTHGNITFASSKMEYGVILSENGYYLDVENNDIHGELPTVPIMQYTGLKDKNSKEIYEGDVLNLGFKNTFFVTYENGSFVLINAKVKDEEGNNIRWGLLSRCFDADLIETIKIEIIGNIHENSNLIK